MKDSSVVQKGEIKLLKDWLGDGNDLMKGQAKKLKLELRYKATRDGYTANDYWNKVQGLENCFVFAKSNFVFRNRVFRFQNR